MEGIKETRSVCAHGCMAVHLQGMRTHVVGSCGFCSEAFYMFFETIVPLLTISSLRHCLHFIL